MGFVPLLSRSILRLTTMLSIDLNICLDDIHNERRDLAHIEGRYPRDRDEIRVRDIGETGGVGLASSLPGGNVQDCAGIYTPHRGWATHLLLASSTACIGYNPRPSAQSVPVSNQTRSTILKAQLLINSLLEYPGFDGGAVRLLPLSP